MLQLRDRDTASKGDRRWYSPESDVANMVPKVLKRTFLRCDPDNLSVLEKYLLAELHLTNEDLAQVAGSMARLISVLRRSDVDIMGALELLNIVEIRDEDEEKETKRFKLRDEIMEQIQNNELELDTNSPLQSLSNQKWCLFAGVLPSKAYLFVGMVFFQEMLRQFMDSYRDTVTLGEEDPNEPEIRALSAVLSPKPAKISWWRKLTAKLYWRANVSGK